MNHSQISTIFDVTLDERGVGHITYSNHLGSGYLGGPYLKQYSGEPAEMKRLANRLQKDYDRERET